MAYGKATSTYSSNFRRTIKEVFELTTEDDILGLYDIEQNYDQKNIDSISKTLGKKR